ncbi:DUF423 domain-containing protein [Christiangramia sediminis]|uniref:DUF423 domain-containing protein n=1 Tax=Christiangramia sediminis TaxID=2881336 RepID=A0A9X1RV75_9FLAO|nr:DUF423 domain-containing protein [Christiangramia sediminis]MCB7479824.1 DUF423 domain-containing protein [Christiangramia sediminis]
MKDWSFQVKNSPVEISKHLKSSLESAKRFAFDMKHHKGDRVNFSLRKRLLLPFEINTQNNIIVNGKISKTKLSNETDVVVSFSQHPLSKLLTYGHIVLGLGFLAAIILEYSNNLYTYLIAGILIVIGVLLGFHLKRSFDKNVKEYKKLISEILDQNLNYSK